MPPRGNNGKAAQPKGAASRPYAALQGVGRAMEILEAVAERPMKASEIADHLGLKWTTAHRSLTYLTDNRYLRRDEASGTYQIGPRLHFLGQSYLQNHPLLDAGASALRVLAAETGASCQLNEREGFLVTVLMAVDPALEMIPKTSAEYRFPLHTGSKGLVLLAYSDASVFTEMIKHPLVALTPKSITDPQVLAAILDRIRQDGYVLTEGDVQLNTGSVAAPIFANGGVLAGTVCGIVKASQLAQESYRAELIEAVTTTARDVSIRMGWRHGDPLACLESWRDLQATA